MDGMDTNKNDSSVPVTGTRASDMFRRPEFDGRSGGNGGRRFVAAVASGQARANGGRRFVAAVASGQAGIMA